MPSPRCSAPGPSSFSLFSPRLSAPLAGASNLPGGSAACPPPLRSGGLLLPLDPPERSRRWCRGLQRRDPGELGQQVVAVPDRREPERRAERHDAVDAPAPEAGRKLAEFV